MISIANEAVALHCEADGSRTVIEDLRRHVSWQLDDLTRTAIPLGGSRAGLPTGSAAVLSPVALQQQYEVAGCRVRFVWELLPDGVTVTVSADESKTALNGVALPGSFAPLDGALTLALPIMQGVLYDGRGAAFEDAINYGGHEQFSMAMLGYLSERGGLLLSIEDYADWRGVLGKRADGRHYVYAEQIASLGALRYARRAHLYLTDARLTPLCKRYRQRIQQRGEWKGWAEKIAAKPAVEHLFGALMAFVGYNQDDLDYVAQCRRLRAMGFERVFIYPVRFNHYSANFRMGGDAPIHLSDNEINAIKALGYDVAPWTWVFEALDDASPATHASFRRDVQQLPIPAWKMDEFQWYQCCTPAQIAFTRRSFNEGMAAMTWSHFDVTATVSPLECYALDHDGHMGYPLDRRADVPLLRELLSAETVGNRVVCSEGFRDILTPAYDIGTTKLPPAFGSAEYWTVPMTLLVYHDSAIHDWWEMHSYNAHASGAFNFPTRFGLKQAGLPRHKAALDALYGCPPNVFPFGRQYRWVDFDARRTESYRVRLEDAAVRDALAAALPVAHLHRRIGKLELVAHEFLSADGALQATIFGDGTRVVANLSAEVREAPDGLIPALTWRTSTT